MEDRLIYTVQEVASILHSSPNYIYELIRKGYLPAIKLGSLKVLKTTLERFLIQNEGKDLSDLNNIRKVVIQVEVENG
jgi:excisionase family DNA binding protein